MKALLTSRRFALVFSLLALFFALLTAFNALRTPLEDTMIDRLRPTPLTSGWSVQVADGLIPLTEPSRPAAGCVNQPLTLTNTLPSALMGNQSLCFQTKNETVRVWVDDMLVYTYGHTPQKVYGHGVGAIWNFVRLPWDAGGQPITVELIPIGGRTGLAPYRFLLGSHDSLRVQLLLESWPSVCACALLAVIGLTSLILALGHKLRRNKNAGAFFHFGMFVLLSTVWVLTDSGLLQYMLPHKGLSYMLFGCSFYLLCSPFAMFMAEMVPQRRRLFRTLSLISTAYAVLRIILYITGTVDFEAALWILHLIMATLILLVDILLLSSILRSKQYRDQELFWATSALVLIAGIALILFYVGDKMNIQRNGYSSGFYLGILAFVLIVIIGVANKSRAIRQQAFRAAFYERRAYTDDLTGLLNVKGFDDKCSALLSAAPTGRCYAVVDFDVNFFSQYNANNGLDEGDELLKRIADTLHNVCTPDELCARQEADHFVCLVHSDSLEGVLERIRSADRMVRDRLSARMLLMSYGVAEVQNRRFSPATLRNHALVAKHTIKGNYERNIAVYDHSLHEAQLKEIELLSGFSAGLENNEYVIFLQPKIDTQTERLNSAEALVRRVLPSGEITSAWTIIKALESKGFVAKLDYYILEQVCRFQRRCIDEGRTPCPVSNNFSRVHLYDPDFPIRVAEVVDRYQIPHELVEVELTETAFLVGKDTLQTTVERLHGFGFRVAIDDFGSGYSSLNMLKDVDVDVIKLDKEFLADCAGNDRADAVIEHTVHLAPIPENEFVNKYLPIA